jgi:FkbM family methyltransferase
MKKTIVALLRGFLGFFPQGLLELLIVRFPRVFVILPDNFRMTFRRYLGDLTVSVDTRYPIEREMLSGQFDPTTLKMINTFVNPGDVCLDIGANAGAVTLALAKKVTKSGRIFAFEPGMVTFNRLMTNIGLNPGFSEIITTYQLGLSDAPGSLYWCEHDENKGDANLSDKPSGNSLLVPVTTIDRHFTALAVAKLDFVKIDVESMEYEVIKGGMETWKKFQPILYYETLKEFEVFRQKHVIKHIEKLLSGLGYFFYKIQPDFSLIQTHYPDVSANTLALPEKTGRLLSL